MKKFIKDIISSTDTASSKRLVTLIIAFHFIIASFVTLFFVFYLIVYIPRGTVNKDLLSMLGKILEYDFFIILAGLGFITAEAMGNIAVEKAKAAASSLPSTIVQQADNVNTNSTKTDTVSAENVETLNSQNTTINPDIKQD